MKKISNGWLATIIIATVIILDQASKIYVKTHFFLGETVDVASWFKITFIENNGMAYGMELGSKMVLTWLRIIFSGLFIYYLVKIRQRTDLPRGFVVCVSLITAGAIGNVIDCIAYGQLFNDPMPTEVATTICSSSQYLTLPMLVSPQASSPSSSSTTSICLATRKTKKKQMKLTRNKPTSRQGSSIVYHCLVCLFTRLLSAKST